MAVGNIKLQSDTGKVLQVEAPAGLSADKVIVPANVGGDNTQAFKVADAVNADEAVSKAQLDLKANIADLKEIGVGQTWQNVTASRSAGVTYTNTTGKPIFIKVNVINTANVTSFINGACICNHNTKTDFTAIVPNGSTYTLGAGVTFYNWSELR